MVLGAKELILYMRTTSAQPGLRFSVFLNRSKTIIIIILASCGGSNFMNYHIKQIEGHHTNNLSGEPSLILPPTDLTCMNQFSIKTLKRQKKHCKRADYREINPGSLCPQTDGLPQGPDAILFESHNNRTRRIDNPSSFLFLICDQA